MTRFWINGNELVNIVYRTILDATGGEIFIPKIAACRLDTLVETIAPNTPIKIIGPRPGEKKHEALTSPEEASRIHEFGSYMVVSPENYPEKRGAAPLSLPEGYQYRSDQVPLLDASQMGEYLQENSQVEPA
jgi:UDP-N-acetylglucosamine 4,6-dehydratase